MENTPVVVEVAESKKNFLFEVTTVSKTLAALLFITLPFAGFWIGTKYSINPENYIYTSTIPEVDDFEQTPQNETPIVPTENVSEGLTIPEGGTLLSAETGIFKGYLSKNVLNENEVLGDVAEGETVTCDTFTITEGDLSMFYRFTEEGSPVSLTQNELPYEIYIGNGDITSLPVMTQDALRKSSPSSPIYAAITEYFSSAGKGLDTCESEVEIFIAL
jgi:hypothetical protein